ncbi:MAG: hypothetical protein ABI999_15060 [Acidobacteriota bacterium]
MAREHSHAPTNFGRAFAIGVTLNLAFVILEVIYGRLSNSLALDAVPEGIDIVAVKQYLADLPTCFDVHDLHIWGMSATETALTAHIVIKEKICDDEMLAKTADELHHKFGIEHTTLQVEFGDPSFPCRCGLV